MNGILGACFAVSSSDCDVPAGVRAPPPKGKILESSPMTQRWARAAAAARAALFLGFVGCAAAVVALFLLAAPTSPDPAAFRGLVVAHRGGSDGAPENTLGAIRRAKRNGATAVEVDVFLSADGVPVVIHDATVDRTTDGSGLVGAMSVAELKKLDAGMGMPGFEGERIPTLEEVLHLAVDLDLKLEIELKTEAKDPDTLAAAVAALYASTNAYDRAWVASFDPRLIYKVRSYDPKIVSAFAFIENATGSPVVDAILVSDFLPKFLGAGILEPHAHVASVDHVYRWRAQGYIINVWTLNGCVDKTWFASLGVSYTTNCPGEDCADDPSDHMHWHNRRDGGGGVCVAPPR